MIINEHSVKLIVQEVEPDFYPLIFIDGHPVHMIGRGQTPALTFRDEETGKEYRCRPVDILTVEG